MRYPYTKPKRVWGPHTNKKILLAALREDTGYMTVFGAMLFLVVSGLLFLCIDGSMTYQAKARCSMAQVGLGEHLLANYNSLLAEKYNLYFLDPGMEEEVMEERASEYYQVLFGSDSGFSFSDNLWRLEEKETEIHPFGNLQENQCANFIAQISEAVKYDAVKDVFLNIFHVSASETKKQAEKIEETVSELEENEADIDSSNQAGDTLKPSEPGGDELLSNGVEATGSLEKIQSILEYGILGVVTDVNILSECSIQSSLLPFQNLKEESNFISIDILKNLTNIKNLVMEENIGQLSENLTTRGELSYYALKHFPCFGAESGDESGNLLYELEYILGGQDSDRENMEYVVNRLVMFRFALNAAYAFTDAGMREQALAVAAGITGIVGMPEFVEAARYMILAAVSLIESVSDAEDLLSEQKVPLIKSAATWKTAIGGEVNGSETENEGLSYQEYLGFLLLTDSDINRICLRMQNLIQLHIQKTEPEFQIEKCMGGIRIVSWTEGRTLFSGEKYTIEEEGIYEY